MISDLCPRASNNEVNIALDSLSTEAANQVGRMVRVILNQSKQHFSQHPSMCIILAKTELLRLILDKCSIDNMAVKGRVKDEQPLSRAPKPLPLLFKLQKPSGSCLVNNEKLPTHLPTSNIPCSITIKFVFWIISVQHS